MIIFVCKYKFIMAEYKNKTSEPLVVNEPMMAYLPLFASLATMDIHQVDEARLSGSALLMIQEQTSLTAQDIANILGVSKSKYYDLLQLKVIGAKHTDALADFSALWQIGLDAFDGSLEQLTAWLHVRNTNLGYVKPIELLFSRVGRRSLEQAFLRIEYSIYG